jgi:carbamoyltransferase
MLIAGINAFHGDAAVAAFRDGQLIRAVEEERLNRIKHSAGFPYLAAKACLQGEIPDHVAISRDPRANLGRKIHFALRQKGRFSHLLSRSRNSLRIAAIGGYLESSGMTSRATKVHFVEHHRAHLASAFLCSPFEEAAVVSIDGFGDFTSMMWGIGRGNRIDVKGAVRFPHSLGVYYSAMTQYLGFPRYGDEYKMMGLSAFGEPRFLDHMRSIVETSGDQCRLNLDYFTHHTHGIELIWAQGEPIMSPVFSPRLAHLFGEEPRTPGTEILPIHADLACSAQLVLKENYFALLNHVQKETGRTKLCLAGGVALNCAANGLILENTNFQDVFIQPAANDAGTSIGAALYVQHQVLNRPRTFVMNHTYYGSEYRDDEIRAAIEQAGLIGYQLDPERLLTETAARIADGKIVGWFQGPMEFGPRALGNRSILADPRRPEMKDVLNRRIKNRESFRPFCPSVTREAQNEYFESDFPSPFMLMAFRVKPHQRDVIPAAVHRDGTCRIQTVDREVNPLYWKLIRAFGDLTGVPVLLNTSFNENEPIVNSPSEAIACFLRTSMDALIIGGYVVTKSDHLEWSGHDSARKSLPTARMGR